MSKDDKNNGYKNKISGLRLSLAPGMDRTIKDDEQKIPDIDSAEGKESSNKYAEDLISKLGKDLTKDELYKLLNRLKDDVIATKKIQEKISLVFQERYPESENVRIETLSDSEKGVNMHFIVDVDSRKFHVKTAALQASSLGSRFNEVIAYKVLEKLKYGPKESSFLLERDSSSDASLMIVTQSLSNSNPDKEDKEVRFSDHRDVKMDENGKEVFILDKNGKPQRRKEILDVPQRDRENVHRCCVHTIIRLLSLHDVKNNIANMGSKHTRRNDVEKSKPFIIDFTLEGLVLDDKITDMIKEFNSDKTQIDHEYLPYVNSPQVRQEAFLKLFGDDGNNVRDIIDEAVRDVLQRFDEKIKSNSENMESITKLSNSWKDGCMRFSEAYRNYMQDIDLKSRSSSPESFSSELSSSEYFSSGSSSDTSRSNSPPTVIEVDLSDITSSVNSGDEVIQETSPSSSLSEAQVRALKISEKVIKGK